MPKKKSESINIGNGFSMVLFAFVTLALLITLLDYLSVLGLLGGVVASIVGTFTIADLSKE
jgi:hypothetical protein